MIANVRRRATSWVTDITVAAGFPLDRPSDKGADFTGKKESHGPFLRRRVPLPAAGHVLCRAWVATDGDTWMNWDALWARMNTPWFTLGETDITLGRVAGLC